MGDQQKAARAKHLKSAIKRETTARVREPSSIERSRSTRRIKEWEGELAALLGVPVPAEPAGGVPARTVDELARENEVLRDALQWLFNESTHYLHTSTKSQSIERAIKNARQVLAR